MVTTLNFQIQYLHETVQNQQEQLRIQPEKIWQLTDQLAVVCSDALRQELKYFIYECLPR